MKLGYIKLYRQLLEKGYYKNSHYVHLWIHLLLKANHKENEFLFNNKIIKIKSGQFITGRNQLSSETKINSSNVERILKVLENEQQIEQQKTNKFRIITIKNYKKYQESEQQNEQPVNNKRTTSEQQVNTNNNDKNDKNDKNDTTAKIKLKQKFFSNILMEEIKKQYPNRDYEFQFELMYNWWIERKKKIPQNISAFTNWLSRTKPEIINNLDKYKNL